MSLFQNFCLSVSWKIYFGFRLFLDSRRKRRDSEDDGDDGEDSDDADQDDDGGN